MESRSWLKNIRVSVIKNGCGYSVLRSLKLAVCQGKINEINWFLEIEFMKAKSYFHNFMVVAIRNGCGLLGLQTLQSADYKNQLKKWADFLYADTNLGKPKVTIIFIS